MLYFYVIWLENIPRYLPQILFCLIYRVKIIVKIILDVTQKNS